MTEVENMGFSFLILRREPKFSTSHITSAVVSVLSKRSWPPYGQQFLNEISVCVNACWIRLCMDVNFMNKISMHLKTPEQLNKICKPLLELSTKIVYEVFPASYISQRKVVFDI